jgi:Tetracyclin repressor-like, C-terminal domain
MVKGQTQRLASIADPLFDLLANVPLHLEHDVGVDRVLEFKRSSHDAIARMRKAIATAVVEFDDAAALDVITAANAIAATLWQATHPAPALARALETDPTLAYIGAATSNRPSPAC